MNDKFIFQKIKKDGVHEDNQKTTYPLCMATAISNMMRSVIFVASSFQGLTIIIVLTQFEGRSIITNHC